LLCASRRGRSSLVQLLLSERAIDINAASPDGWNSLMLASHGRHPRTVEVLIKGGASVSDGGGGDKDLTPLHVAAKVGDIVITTMLLRAGANVKATCAQTGCTPLHLASFVGYLRIMKLLLQFGADVDSRIANGGTALYISAESGQLE
ncbi:unnamed protein product, partial [Ectocarpus sp. 12 AP-2014]